MIIDENNYKDFLSSNGKSLFCDDREITEIKYLPEGLEYLYCDNNKLTYLPELPKSLGLLYCAYNKLTYLPDLPKSLTIIDCDLNPNLPYAGWYNGEEEIKKLRNRINMDLYLLGKI